MSLYLNKSKYHDMADQFSPENEVHKTLTQMQKMSDAIMASNEQYDGTGLELLLHVSDLLVSFTDINPALGQITIDFRNDVEAYISAEAKTLSDAFNVHRPKRWSQKNVKRDIKEMRKLVHKVDNLSDGGMNKYNAFIIAGEESENYKQLGPDMISKLYDKHRDGVYDSDQFAQTSADRHIRFMAYLSKNNN